MALNRKGARRIVVDGTAYLWRVRRRPTYSQAMCWWPCTYAVQHAARPGAVLVVTTDRVRTDNWFGRQSTPVLPGEVADTVRTALGRGWTPALPGPQFLLDLTTGSAAADGGAPRS
ncbi:hypothetical protein [Streptomyces sp. NPDC001380]|uniref:hypothetical protein n=1 Tax=Streptomyces sp. NPDC001380 TaxID=3364566 RepID=UPI0036B225A0